MPNKPIEIADKQAAPKITPPESLDSNYHPLFKTIGEYLRENLSLNEADYSLIENYCQTSRLIDMCRATIEKEGVTVQKPQGLAMHPSYVIMNQSLGTLVKLGGAIGLGAAVRKRLQTETEHEAAKAKSVEKVANKWAAVK